MDIGACSVALLVGGLATRLRPVTDTIPKSLVPVAGKPFIAHQIELLKTAGLRRLVLCTGHLGEKIEVSLKDGASFGVRIQYSPDGPTLRGTAGAIRNALPLLSDPFLVLYGDSYLPIDYSKAVEAFEQAGRPALMAVFANQNRWDKSNVVLEGNRVKKYDNKQSPEMQYIDYGVSVFSKKVFQDPKLEGLKDLPDVFKILSQKGDLAALEVSQRFYEIGTPAGLAELETFLQETRKA